MLVTTMQRHNKYTDALIRFIAASPTAFHATASIATLLRHNGFIQLDEEECWHHLPAGKYFVVRNDSSLIAFRWKDRNVGISMVGAHTDSPGLRLKPNPLHREQNYLRLGVEIYGNALLRPWFDRELSLAGRVSWYEEDGYSYSALLDFKRPMGIIPSLAIHLNREANGQQAVNAQTDVVPLAGLFDGDNGDFQLILHDQLRRQYPEAAPVWFIDHELFLYDAVPPALTGMSGEFISGARLDNLVSCFAAAHALLKADSDKNCLIVLNDHEEVGSVSAAGAQGPFLYDILERLLPDGENRQAVLRKSFLISADNAHALHPNYIAKHDPQHLPLMGKGLVIKFNADHRYATNAPAATRFRQLCAHAGVPVQEFVSRNDLVCGSTLGPVTAAKIGIDTVDVGVPSLAMHSIREIVASIDCWYLYSVLRFFFSPDAGRAVTTGQSRKNPLRLRRTLAASGRGISQNICFGTAA
jgi:aspartyl aminopeptidase